MKRFFSTILIFAGAINLYCFDLIEDTFDFIFDDLAKVIGIVVIIAVVVYFVKKVIKDDDNKNNSKDKNINKEIQK